MSNVAYLGLSNSDLAAFYERINQDLGSLTAASKGVDPNPIPSERAGLPESVSEHRAFVLAVREEMHQRGLV